MITVVLHRWRFFVGTMIAFLCALNVQAEQPTSCERLKSTLSYTQEEAPRDLSGVLPVVVERVNRELEGVVDVEVEWTGSDLHGRVGDHIIQCKVTRLVSAIDHPDTMMHHHDDAIQLDSEGRQVMIQCFQLPFTISDTNECSLPLGHAMRHKCRAPAMCVNTIGAYECVCPRLGEGTGSSSSNITPDAAFWTDIMQHQNRNAWEVSYNTSTKTSCPSKPSTIHCCPAMAHTTEGKSCRASFACPPDPCTTPDDGKVTTNTCASNAQCVRKESPLADPPFTCVCPNGFMGSGLKCKPSDVQPPRPMVKFDGVTPTEETIRNNYYCGCTIPEVDACEGFPPCKGNHEICVVTSGNSPRCACKPGYVDNNDGYGCVDESPPVLKLRPVDGQVMQLTQGDFYKEHAVDIVDENAEEYLRSLRITYSKPLPPGCLTEMGEFHVNYTVATPWTSYQFVRVTRRVVVDDIDECSIRVGSNLSTLCPALIPQCDTNAGAKCVNTKGSYKCECPKHTSGDGFKPLTNSKMTIPDGYKGGTGCVDTSKPVIEVLGPNPKILRVCKCGGLTGIMGNGSGGDPSQDRTCAQQRSKYGSNLKDLIESTKGAELCATHGNPNPRPSACIKASDHTYLGIVDVTSRVVIGDPVEKSTLHWSIPYDVIDAAGNKAVTVWRDVVVEEVDIFDLEHKVRKEVMMEKDNALKDAVRKAVAEERSKHQTSTRRDDKKVDSGTTCPACPSCPKCNCSSGKVNDISNCDKYCETKYAGVCPKISLLDEMQLLLASDVVVWIIVIGVSLMAIRLFVTLMLNPGALLGTTQYSNNNNANNNNRNAALQLGTPQVPSASIATPTGLGQDQQQQQQPLRDATYSDPTHGNGYMGTGTSFRIPEGGLFSPQQNRMVQQNQQAPLTPSSYGYSGTIANQKSDDADENHDGYDDSIYATSNDYIIRPHPSGGL